MTSAARPRRAALPVRRAVLPLAILAGAVGTVLLVQVAFDPFTQHVPLCVVHAVTGLECPGCGATRAVHALVDGELLLALRNNAPVVLALPVAAFALLRWGASRVHPGVRPLRMPPTGVVVAITLVLALYTVARNLPQFSVLAPTSLVGA